MEASKPKALGLVLLGKIPIVLTCNFKTLMKEKGASSNGEAIGRANAHEFLDDVKDVLDIGLIAKDTFSFAFDTVWDILIPFIDFARESDCLMVVLSNVWDNGDEGRWVDASMGVTMVISRKGKEGDPERYILQEYQKMIAGIPKVYHVQKPFSKFRVEYTEDKGKFMIMKRVIAMDSPNHYF